MPPKGTHANWDTLTHGHKHEIGYKQRDLLKRTVKNIQVRRFSDIKPHLIFVTTYHWWPQRCTG